MNIYDAGAAIVLEDEFPSYLMKIVFETMSFKVGDQIF